MKDIGGGFSVPEARFNPQPFYYEYPPPIYRWQELNWRYDAAQRWFYTCFTGRTMGSVWLSEVNIQTDATANAMNLVGDYSDPLNWSMPAFVRNNVALGTLGHPVGFRNYISLGENMRPANPKTLRAAQVAADEIYIATRHSFPRVAMRLDMRLPSAAQIAARSTVADDTIMAAGFEINSQGGQSAYYLMLHSDGASTAYYVNVIGFGAGTRQSYSVPITINNPDVWAEYYFEYDPPVFRFVQPTAGNVSFLANPAVTELSVDAMPATTYVQPFICNESAEASGAASAAPLTWLVNTWAIWPLHNTNTRYMINKRTNPLNTCAPFSAIWDSGGAEQILIYVKTLGSACTYTVEWSDEGKDQLATYPEVRTWRRIDDSDYTGTTGATTGIASMGLFAAARFYRVTLCGCNACGTEEICFTGNKTGRG